MYTHKDLERELLEFYNQATKEKLMAKQTKKASKKKARRSTDQVNATIAKIKTGIEDGTYSSAVEACKKNKMAYSQYQKFKNRVWPDEAQVVDDVKPKKEKKASVVSIQKIKDLIEDIERDIERYKDRMKDHQAQVARCDTMIDQAEINLSNLQELIENKKD